MSISYGTYASDGIRVGPTFSRQTTTTPNTNASNTVFSGNNNLLAQGVLLAPWNTYNIVPATTAAPNANVVAASTQGAGVMALTQDTTVTDLVRLGNGNTVCQFDWPRTITVAVTGATTTNIIVQGTDYYGLPLQETIILTAATTGTGKKAFWAVTSVYTSAAVTALSVGASTTTFGLPYRINDQSYVEGYYGGNLLSENGFYSEILTAAMTAGTITVADATLNARDALVPVIATPAATAANVGAVFISARTNGTGFTVKSTNVADTSTVLVLVTRSAAGVIILADGTSPATSATGDVRGTITITGAADGTSRLMVYMYVQGADVWFNQQASLNIPANPPVNTYVPLQIADLIGVPQYYTGING